MSVKTAVLLLQMGGPDSLEAVEPFLFNLFSDRDIIKIGPAFLQPLIARFIARRRAPKSVAFYEKIGGRSPIRELTELQARALENLLGSEFRCFVAACSHLDGDDVEELQNLRLCFVFHVTSAFCGDPSTGSG